MPDAIIDVLAVRQDQPEVLPLIRALTASHFRALDYMRTHEQDLILCVSPSARAKSTTVCRNIWVQYLYQDTLKPQQEADTLTSEKLAILPQALRQELRDVLESLDSAGIAVIISRISETEAELASTLSSLTKKYDYQPILIAPGGIIDD